MDTLNADALHALGQARRQAGHGDKLRSTVCQSSLDDMLLFHSDWPTRYDDAVWLREVKR